MFFLFVKNKFLFLSFDIYKWDNQTAVKLSKTFLPLCFRHSLFWRMLLSIQAWGSQWPTHVSFPLHSVLLLVVKESETKEVEFEQSIKMPALQIFSVILGHCHTQGLYLGHGIERWRLNSEL